MPISRIGELSSTGNDLCVLKVPIGEHVIGKSVDVIVVDFKRGILSLCLVDGTTKEEKYSLNLRVGEKIEDDRTG